MHEFTNDFPIVFYPFFHVIYRAQNIVFISSRLHLLREGIDVARTKDDKICDISLTGQIV